MANLGDIVQKQCEGRCKTVTPHLYQGKWFDEENGEEYKDLINTEIYRQLRGSEQYECCKCHNVSLKKN
jgi:hypothetical protein